MKRLVVPSFTLPAALFEAVAGADEVEPPVGLLAVAVMAVPFAALLLVDVTIVADDCTRLVAGAVALAEE